MGADKSVEQVISPLNLGDRRKSSITSLKSSERIQHSTGGLFDRVRSNEDSKSVSYSLMRVIFC